MYLQSKIETEKPCTYTPDLDGLIAFLRTKPGETVYDSMNVSGCVFGQFYTAMGLEPPLMPSILHQYRDAADIAYSEPNTFGAALARAIALRDGP
jgi:hypothetical protein